MRGLSPVAASGGHSSSRCAGLSLSRPLLLRSTGSRRAGSVIVAHGPSCSAACGIFPDQGSNPCPPHWQADSQPLHHQGSPQKRQILVLCSLCPITFPVTWWFLFFLYFHSFSNPPGGFSTLQVKKVGSGASLVAQWLRILLPTQGAQVRALVQEDPTCRGATKPVSHNY